MKTYDNEGLCEAIGRAFTTFLKTGSRSDKKLHDIHGKIAADLDEALEDVRDMFPGREIKVISKGFGENREMKVPGAEMGKDVDITVTCDNVPVGAVMVKMIQGNYKQNGNNYFESMKGETDNLRAGGVPVFQVFIIPDKMPYYTKKNDAFSKWEILNEHDVEKYQKLGKRPIEKDMAIPDAFFYFDYHIEDMPENPATRKDYVQYYLDNGVKVEQGHKFDNDDWGNIIHNDYNALMKEMMRVMLDKIPNDF